MISSKLLKFKNNEINAHSTNFQTINGEKKTKGTVKLKIRIFNIEEVEVDLFVIDGKNFKYDILIGLNMIKTFRLHQDEHLKITQKTIETDRKHSCEYEKNTIATANNDQRNENECKTPDVDRVNFNEHIKVENFEIYINHLSKEYQSKICELIDNYKTIFARDRFDTGTVRHYEARIDLKVDKYCSKRPYRCSIEDRNEIEEQASKLLEKGLIEESYSPFAAPVTLAYKREDGKKTRLCIDFRELNTSVTAIPPH